MEAAGTSGLTSWARKPAKTGSSTQVPPGAVAAMRDELSKALGGGRPVPTSPRPSTSASSSPASASGSQLVGLQLATGEVIYVPQKAIDKGAVGAKRSSPSNGMSGLGQFNAAKRQQTRGRYVTEDQKALGDCVGRQEPGFVPPRSLHLPAPVESLRLPEATENPVARLPTSVETSRPSFSGEASSSELQEMRQEILTTRSMAEAALHHSMAVADGVRFVEGKVDSLAEQIEVREAKRAERQQQRDMDIARKFADVERQYAKQCLMLTGRAIPPPKRGEDVADLAQQLIRQKWEISVPSEEFLNCHRVGRGIIIRMARHGQGSYFERLTKRFGNWNGPPRSHAMHLDCQVRLAELDKESDCLLRFFREIEDALPMERRRVGAHHKTQAGFVRYRTGKELHRQNMEKGRKDGFVAPWIWVTHPDDLMGLFANDRELQAYRRRCGDTVFLGVVRSKRARRGGKGKKQLREVEEGSRSGVPASPRSTVSEMSAPVEEMLADGMEAVGVEGEE